MGVNYSAEQLAKTPAGQRSGFTAPPAAQRPAPQPIFTQEVYEATSGELVIEIEPMGAPRINPADKWKKREVVERYHRLKDKVRSDCATLGYKLSGVLTIRFEFTMPPSWSDKKKALHAGRPHQQKPDLDNCIKAVMDAFNADDSHVHTIAARKTWAHRGRIVISR